MKSAIFAVALMMSGAAFAQDDLKTDAYDATFAQDDLKTDTYVADTQMVPAGAQIMQPGNNDPEHDARGIAVISDPAFIPAGFNLTADVGAVGGPFVDASTVTQPAGEPYQACTATVTDNCVQTYERGLGTR